MYEFGFMSLVYAMFTHLSRFGTIRTQIINDLSYSKKQEIFFFLQEIKRILFLLDERSNVISFLHSHLSFCLYYHQLFINLHFVNYRVVQFHAFYYDAKWWKFNWY